MAIGVSGSSSFANASTAANQSANNQKFAKMFGKKNLSGTDLATPTALIGAGVIAFLMLKKKLGK